jgi:hypothetical protein
MSEIPSDNRPEVADLQRTLLRQVGSARKLAMLCEMNKTVKTLALSGLRTRYPDDSPVILRRRLADRIPGPERAAQVYGPLEKN